MGTVPGGSPSPELEGATPAQQALEDPWEGGQPLKGALLDNTALIEDQDLVSRGTGVGMVRHNDHRAMAGQLVGCVADQLCPHRVEG